MVYLLNRAILRKASDRDLALHVRQAELLGESGAACAWKPDMHANCVLYLLCKDADDVGACKP